MLDCLIDQPSGPSIDSPALLAANQIIIGNPIDLPALNATNHIERLFNVLPGGRLDLRAVQLYPGGGRALFNGRTRLAVGTAIKVYPGGFVRGAGVIFRTARQTLQGFMNDLRDPLLTRRNFGGMVMVAGGDFTCYGCHIVRFNPYGSPDFNGVTVGGNFLVLLGTLTCVGCYNVGFNLFSSGINVGGNAAVLGGSLAWIGGGGSGATAAVGQFGAGQTNFVGGGVLVMVGYQVRTWSGLLTLPWMICVYGRGEACSYVCNLPLLSLTSTHKHRTSARSSPSAARASGSTAWAPGCSR